MSPWAKKVAHNEIRKLRKRGWEVSKIATFTNTPCSKVRKVLGLEVPKMVATPSPTATSILN